MSWMTAVKSWFSKSVEQVVNEFTLQSTNQFPCKECIILLVCNKFCDKIEMDDKKVYEKMMKYKACPDCGGTTLREGPCGGASQNVTCVGCRHKFNIMGAFWDVQRIGIESIDRLH